MLLSTLKFFVLFAGVLSAIGHNGPAKIGLAEIGIDAIGPAQIGPAKIVPAEIGPVEIGPAQIGPPEIGPAEIIICQIGEREIDNVMDMGRVCGKISTD